MAKKWYEQTLGEWVGNTLKPAVSTAVNATKKYNQQASTPAKTQTVSKPQGQNYNGVNYTNIGTWETPAVKTTKPAGGTGLNLTGMYDYMKGTRLGGGSAPVLPKTTGKGADGGGGGAVAGYLGGGYSAYPGYVSPYEAQLQAALNKLLNRKEFSYDYMSDPLYQQYAKQYGIQGDLARQDTLGDVASMTGGMPSSYAVSAAQQAQNSWNSALNDIIPQLQEAAYKKYMGDYEADANLVSMLSSLDGMAYDRYNQDRNYNLALQEANNQARRTVTTTGGGDKFSGIGAAYASLMNSGLSGEDWVAQYGEQLTDEQWEAIMEQLNNNMYGGLMG